MRTRVAAGGHDVDDSKLLQRFPRTQKAIRNASAVADATILADNSGLEQEAFTVCRVQVGKLEAYDCRGVLEDPSQAVLQWLDIVSPR